MAKNETKEPENKKDVTAEVEKTAAVVADKPIEVEKLLDNVVPFDKNDEKAAPPTNADKSAKAVTSKDADKAQAGKPPKESTEKSLLLQM